MPDVIFKCDTCSKHLVVDGAATGKTLNCVDCGRPVRVPVDTIPVACPACGWGLAAPASITGDTFHCPNCEEPFVVPDVATAGRVQPLDMPRKSALRVAAQRPTTAQSGAIKNCPECASPIPRGTILCARCGHNTYTGTVSKVRNHTADTRRPEAPSQRIKCPYCAEPIMAEAVKCRHCGEFVSEPRGRVQPSSPGDAGGLPKMVAAAVELFRVSVIYTCLSFSFRMDYKDVTATFWMELVGFCLFVGLLFLLFIKVKAGRNWARIVTLVLTVLSLLGLPFAALVGSAEPFSFWDVLDLVQFAVDLAVTVLLFTPSANAWFRLKKQELQG